MNAAERIYAESFAEWAPQMRQRWIGVTDVVRLFHAKADVLATLKLHDEPSAYTGKLYAELDAIRDAELAIRRAVMKTCKRCGSAHRADRSCGCFDNNGQ
jgi:hypothetical protein